MTEQKQHDGEEALLEEVITYTKTENDVNVAIAQLVEDPKKLSIENGRWIVDTRKKFAICLSEEFEEAVMSCTQHNQAEWGGLIVGNDIKWTNPENNRQMQILIVERVVILGQTRTGASFEIKQSAVEKWMDSEAEDAMAFKIVFAKNRWQKIGWVHSHGDLGVFWSGTDIATIAELRGVSTLLSIVYSRTKDTQLSRLVRVDKNDVLLGGKYNLYKDDVEDAFIISERTIEKLEDVSVEIQEKYKEILAQTEILYTTSHQNPATKTLTTVSDFSRYTTAKEKYTNITKEKQLSKHTIVHGAISEKAKEEIIKFGNFHYALTPEGRSKTRNLNLSDFFILMDDSMIDQLKSEGLNKKWKMKDIVNILDEQQILNIISFYKNSEISVQLAIKTYHNFKQFADRLLWLLTLRLVNDLELATKISDIAGDDWIVAVSDSLVEVETLVLDIDEVEELAEELKPVPFMPNSAFTDWKIWYPTLSKKHKADFWETIFDMEGDDDRQRKLLDRAEDAVLFEIRGDEGKYVNYAAVVYQCFVDMWKKTNKKNQESYRNFYTSYYINAFKPYFATTKYHNEKIPRLQLLLNALDEKYIKQFLNDFVCSYDTDEELEEIAKKYSKEYPILKQTFKCPLCGIQWLVKKDAESCEEECQKRGRTISNTVIEVEAVSTTKKELASTQRNEELQNVSDGWTATDEQTQRIASNNVFGVSVKYYEGLNVCDLCGTLFDTQEAAEVCLEQCVDLLVDVKNYFISKDGVYSCSFCGTNLVDEDTCLLHSNDCKEYGTILGYILYVVTSPDISTAEGMTIINSHYSSRGGFPAPFMEWLIRKGVNGKDVFVCDVCNAKNIPSKLGMVDRMLRGYAHESYCEYDEKHEILEWTGFDYECKLCSSYTFTTASTAIMLSHLYYKHGFYPTMEQISDFETKSSETLSGVDAISGDTEDAILLEDCFVCKHCGVFRKFVRPENLKDHMRIEHQIVIQTLQQQQWLYHEVAMDKLMVSAFSPYVAKPKKKIVTEQLVTKNVKAYNGIFVCSYCESTVGNVNGMRKHLFDEHRISMTFTEENILLDYSEEYLKKVEKEKDIADENKSIAIDFDNAEHLSENLEEIQEKWLEAKEKENKPKVVCEACGEVFLDGEESFDNIWNCFIHEVECRNLSTFGLDAFKCGICGTINMTIIEREICEEGHLEKSDLGGFY